jgi:hypothetical protein
MTTSRTGLHALFALLLASWPTAVAAQATQSLSIVPVQDLAFGLLLPGRREAITINDVSRRAVVALAGSGPIDVSLVLPDALETHAGDRIQLHFSTGDAALLTTGGTTLSPLDPLQVNRVLLANDRTVLFVLGGTAVTSHATRPGHYTARVTLLLSNPGT